MPRYDFVCAKCGAVCEKIMSMKVVSTPKEPKFYCEECKNKKPLQRRISVARIRMKAPTFERKMYPRKSDLEKEMGMINEIMNEPVTPSEIQAGNDMLKEREKDLGYDEGKLTGGKKVKKALTPTELSALKDRSKKKIEKAREARGVKGV